MKVTNVNNNEAMFKPIEVRVVIENPVDKEAFKEIRDYLTSECLEGDLTSTKSAAVIYLLLKSIAEEVLKDA